MEQSSKLKMILSPEEIQARVAEMASEMAQSLGGQELFLLGVLKGAFIFLSDLMRSLPVPAQVDFVRLASYGAGTESSGSITITKDCEADVTGKTVVVVEDIVDTGLTLTWLVDHLKSRGAAQVKLCTFIDKPERREVELNIDYVGFNIPKGFLVGYGLDFNERYRGLPGVYEIIQAG